MKKVPKIKKVFSKFWKNFDTQQKINNNKNSKYQYNLRKNLKNIDIF